MMKIKRMRGEKAKRRRVGGKDRKQKGRKKKKGMKYKGDVMRVLPLEMNDDIQ